MQYINVKLPAVKQLTYLSMIWLWGKIRFPAKRNLFAEISYFFAKQIDVKFHKILHSFLFFCKFFQKKCKILQTSFWNKKEIFGESSHFPWIIRLPQHFKRRTFLSIQTGYECNGRSRFRKSQSCFECSDQKHSRAGRHLIRNNDWRDGHWKHDIE